MLSLKKAGLCGTALVASLLVAGAGAASAETTITYGDFMPEPHLVHKYGLEPMFKEVEAATDGALTFELFVGGAMGGPKAMLSNVRDRVTDSALIVDAYAKSDLPASAALTELAVLGTDAMAMAGAVNEMQLLNCKQCDEERARNNLKGLAYYSTATYRLMCAEPLTEVRDLQGLKVRTASAFGVLTEALGGTPVSIPASEMYEALQRGQVDCTIGSLAHLTSYNLKDVVKSIVDMPLGTFHGVLVFPINVEKWGDLNESERSALIKGMPGLVSGIVNGYNEEANDAFAQAQAGDVKIVEPSPEFVSKVAAHRENEYDRVVEKAQEAGIQDADQMISDFFELVEKWEKLVAGIDHDPKRFQEVLWQEVFSKVDIKD